MDFRAEFSGNMQGTIEIARGEIDDSGEDSSEEN